VAQVIIHTVPIPQSPATIHVGPHLADAPPIELPKQPSTGKPIFHAVFISGLPKLPSPIVQAYYSGKISGTMSLDINGLDVQPQG
jgi:hypothetical protein